MKNPEEYQKSAEKRRGWLTCDPATLVTAAREGLHEVPEGQRTEISGPLEEVIARYEAQSRAALGASFVESFSGSSSIR